MQVVNSQEDRQDLATYDVVVVGGGAAGLSGALTLGPARRSVLVVDGGEPRNAPAAAVHGFLSRDGISPAELLEIGRAEIRGYGAYVLDLLRLGGLMETWFQRSTRRRRSAEHKTAVPAGISP
ncbi:MAG: FAD-binding protein [Rubrobacter sp.]